MHFPLRNKLSVHVLVSAICTCMQSLLFVHGGKDFLCVNLVDDDIQVNDSQSHSRSLIFRISVTISNKVIKMGLSGVNKA